MRTFKNSHWEHPFPTWVSDEPKSSRHRLPRYFRCRRRARNPHPCRRGRNGWRDPTGDDNDKIMHMQKKTLIFCRLKDSPLSSPSNRIVAFPFSQSCFIWFGRKQSSCRFGVEINTDQVLVHSPSFMEQSSAHHLVRKHAC